MRRDQRSQRAETYRAWYKLAAWLRRRAEQLRVHPICERCDAAGFVVPATVADHDPPHNGDWEAFINGPLTSLCKPCHDGPKQSQERGGSGGQGIGYSKGVDARGVPTDPRHPWNR